MKVLVFGAGVIGTIYGYALAQAGNDVTHYVRPGKMKRLENGVGIKLLDGRGERPVDKDVLYRLKATETISPDHECDIILVSMRHYQVGLVLPLLQENADHADVLFFNTFWDRFEPVDAYLPRLKYPWGFPVAGGGYRDGELEAALFGEVHLGKVDGQRTPGSSRSASCSGDRGSGWRSRTASSIGGGCTSPSTAGSSPRPSGLEEIMSGFLHLRRGILASRDALAVCQARGVDVRSFDDARSFYLPALLGAAAVRHRMKTNRSARNIMETHTAVDELQRIYLDLLRTDEELWVGMPHYLALRPFVDCPIPPDRASM